MVHYYKERESSRCEAEHMLQGMFGKRLAEHFSLLESSSLVFGPKGNSQVALTRMRMPNGFPGPTPHIPPEKAFSISVHLRRPDSIKEFVAVPLQSASVQTKNISLPS